MTATAGGHPPDGHPPDGHPPDGVPPLRVLVADDQTTVREGLVTLLGLAPGIQVVGAAADGAQAIALTADLHPDVMLMDLGMPTIDGATATTRIRAEQPETQVVVLTTSPTTPKSWPHCTPAPWATSPRTPTAPQITRALHTAAAGQAVLDPAVHARLLAAASTNTPVPSGAAAPLPDGLTAREAEVLALIAAGLTNTQIVGRLYVTEATVKTTSTTCSARPGRTTARRPSATTTTTTSPTRRPITGSRR